MEFLDVLRSRRAVRQFTDEVPARGTLEHLIEAATLAPSAMNSQPWSFAVVTGVAKLEELARRARDYQLANALLPPGLRELLADPRYSLFHHAPALVVILAAEDTAQAHEDCCLAASAFMLAARAEDLGTCWIGLARPWLDLAATKLELGIPPGRFVAAPIVVGHPREWPVPTPRFAPEIHWLA